MDNKEELIQKLSDLIPVHQAEPETQKQVHQSENELPETHKQDVTQYSLIPKDPEMTEEHTLELSLELERVMKEKHALEAVNEALATELVKTRAQLQAANLVIQMMTDMGAQHLKLQIVKPQVESDKK